MFSHTFRSLGSHRADLSPLPIVGHVTHVWTFREFQFLPPCDNDWLSQKSQWVSSPKLCKTVWGRVGPISAGIASLAVCKSRRTGVIFCFDRKTCWHKGKQEGEKEIEFMWHHLKLWIQLCLKLDYPCTLLPVSIGFLSLLPRVSAAHSLLAEGQGWVLPHSPWPDLECPLAGQCSLRRNGCNVLGFIYHQTLRVFP